MEGIIAKIGNISTQYEGNYIDDGLSLIFFIQCVTEATILIRFVILSQITVIIGFTSFKSAP